MDARTLLAMIFFWVSSFPAILSAEETAVEKRIQKTPLATTLPQQGVAQQVDQKIRHLASKMPPLVFDGKDPKSPWTQFEFEINGASFTRRVIIESRGTQAALLALNEEGLPYLYFGPTYTARLVNSKKPYWEISKPMQFSFGFEVTDDKYHIKLNLHSGSVAKAKEKQEKAKAKKKESDFLAFAFSWEEGLNLQRKKAIEVNKEKEDNRHSNYRVDLSSWMQKENYSQGTVVNWSDLKNHLQFKVIQSGRVCEYVFQTKDAEDFDQYPIISFDSRKSQRDTLSLRNISIGKPFVNSILDFKNLPYAYSNIIQSDVSEFVKGSAQSEVSIVLLPVFASLSYEAGLTETKRGEKLAYYFMAQRASPKKISFHKSSIESMVETIENKALSETHRVKTLIELRKYLIDKLEPMQDVSEEVLKLSKFKSKVINRNWNAIDRLIGKKLHQRIDHAVLAIASNKEYTPRFRANAFKYMGALGIFFNHRDWPRTQFQIELSLITNEEEDGSGDEKVIEKEEIEKNKKRFLIIFWRTTKLELRKSSEEEIDEIVGWINDPESLSADQPVQILLFLSLINADREEQIKSKRLDAILREVKMEELKSELLLSLIGTNTGAEWIQRNIVEVKNHPCAISARMVLILYEKLGGKKVLKMRLDQI